MSSPIIRHESAPVRNATTDQHHNYLVQSQGGEIIDTSGLIWRVGTENVVSWKGFDRLPHDITLACQAYIRHLIRNNAPDYVTGQHRSLRMLAREPLLSLASLISTQNDVLERDAFELFKSTARKSVSEHNIGSYTGAYVRWYIWATDAGFASFDPDVASEFEGLVINKNPMGQAVLSNDPNRGPLKEVEMTSLRAALKAAERDDTLDLQDLTLAWLMVAFGTNPKNLVLLQEEDLIRTDLSDGQTVYELRIPRIKKRNAGDRDQFRTRRMVPEIGRLVERLIAQNQAANIFGIEDASRPIFRATRPRPSLLETPFETKAFRRKSAWFNERISFVSQRLALRNVSGEPLKLTPRRLRYSFATRLVQEGASIQDVADALDHSSTDFVMVYFNARSDAVRQLDRALSAILAPIAQAFLGKIIQDPSEAAKSEDLSSRVRHRNSKSKRFATIGNCGKLGVCGLFAPIACYTCNSFQAWLDAPHEEVLEALEARRETKLAEGADPKWTQLFDETILAVQLVMLRCEAIKAGDDC